MDINHTNIPDYKSLLEKGLVLPEKELQIIYNEVSKGATSVTKYLNAESVSTPSLVFSSNIGIIGYSSVLDAINLPINYLNLVSKNTTQIEYRDQLVCYVPNKFYMILKYLNWLKLFGIEETIHYFQRHGNSGLKIKFPDKLPGALSPKSLLLSDVETEARTIVDKVLAANNEMPIWKNVDDYFSKNFPDYYNKPIEYLMTLPKPDLPISYELESFIT